MAAGLLKEIAIEYVKSVQATHVILHRFLSIILLNLIESNLRKIGPEIH